MLHGHSVCVLYQQHKIPGTIEGFQSRYHYLQYEYTEYLIGYPAVVQSVCGTQRRNNLRYTGARACGRRSVACGARARRAPSRVGGED